MDQKQMKVIGFYEGLPLQEAASFIDQIAPIPTPQEFDLLIAVKAVSVNPVDVKLRESTEKQAELKILGFDGVGEVLAFGEQVTGFAKGDQVYYAGTTKRAGSNQEYQLVDARIVAKAPTKITTAEAAALPLISLTAYELLVDKFGLITQKGANQGKSIVVINGAGGVGSLLNQLAHWLGLTVYSTASPSKFPWLKKLGVDVPIDYHQNLVEQIQATGQNSVDYVAVLHEITPYIQQITQLIAPFGHVGTIVAATTPLAINPWKNLSVSFDWEYMFAKTDYQVSLESQGQILTFIAELIDKGELFSPVEILYDEGINQSTIKKATADVETGHMQGKVVVTGPFNGRIKE